MYLPKKANQPTVLCIQKLLMKIFAEFYLFFSFFASFLTMTKSIMIPPVEMSLGDKPAWALRYQGYCRHCTAQII
jgi:hypothetical protein